MTERQKRGINWSIGGLIAAVMLLVGFAAWGNDTRRTAEEACVKSTQALEYSVENRTARILLADRVGYLEDRMDKMEDSWEASHGLLEDIYDAVMED